MIAAFDPVKIQTFSHVLLLGVIYCGVGLFVGMLIMGGWMWWRIMLKGE
jgi:hypothetical protein